MDGQTHCFWACDKAAHHGGECSAEQNHSPHTSQEAKGEGGRGWGPNIPFKGTPSVT
jgi:hypothetical protein